MVRQRRLRVSALLLAGFLLVGTSCGGGAAEVGSSVQALKGAGEDAMRLLSSEAKPAEYSALSDRLTKMAAEVPDPGGLKADEKEILDTAAQRAQALQEIARMLGVADSVKALFTQDAVTLVRGQLRPLPHSAQFETNLDEAAGKILKEATCDAFANEMNAQNPQPTFTPRPGTAPARPGRNVYGELTQAVTDAKTTLDVVQKYVNLSGLSSDILSKAAGYVGMVKKTVTAASWQNGAAAHAYFQVCVYP